MTTDTNAGDFTQFALDKRILNTLAAGSYTSPTPIQCQAIPPALEGRDIVGIAQTGTGKTAAFSLPALHRLSQNRQGPKAWQCHMLVLAPTRELAQQIATSMVGYGKGLGLYVTTAFGGVPINRQKRELQRGVDVLVATPGRLLDLVDQRSLDLSAVKILVLDEADQMLDLGFIHALKRIAMLVPKQRQSLFFSATMPSTIAELSGRFLTDPVKVSVAPAATTAERIEQIAFFPRSADKPRLLAHLIRREDPDRVLIFCRTKHGCDKLVKGLEFAGIESAAIHGNKSQPQREKALNAFRKGQVPILVATDIAARGIDVSGVSHVFNYELPNVPDQYVHRIGRTGRADASGIAIALVGPEERQWLRDIEKLTRVRLEVEPLPKGFDKPEVAELPPPVQGQRSSRGQHQARPVGQPARSGQGRGGQGRSGEGHANQSRGNGAGRPAQGKPAEGRGGNGGDRGAVANPLHVRSGRSTGSSGGMANGGGGKPGGYANAGGFNRGGPRNGAARRPGGGGRPAR